MKKPRFQFAIGFILGAVLFGSISAFAAVGIIANQSTSKVVVDNKEVKVEAYLINERNYFQLRDLAEVVGFDVAYDGANNTVYIYTKGNQPEFQATTPTPQPTQQAEVTSKDISNFSYKVGDTPGNILIDPTDPNTKGASKYTDAYQYGSIGQCVWYAKSRFFEVHGTRLALYDMGDIKDWIANANQFEGIKSISDINSIQSHSIAVYKPNDSKQLGHVVFVEWVERDSNGNPLNVYFTETNGAKTLNKGQFDPGYDGAVQKVTFKQFTEKSNLTLIGYIVPNK